MGSRVNLSGYAEEMIKKIKRYREALGFQECEASLILEIALNGYLNELEDLVRLDKTIKSGGKK